MIELSRWVFRGCDTLYAGGWQSYVCGPVQVVTLYKQVGASAMQAGLYE